MTFRSVAIFMVATLSGTAPALAQQFPNKAIRFIVAFPPGGSVDLHARHVGAKMAENLGQPIVIENRPGGNTHVGAEVVVRSSPDGYTLFHTLDSTITLNQALYSTVPFDPIKDFTPVARLASGNSLLVVHPSLPVKNVRELIDYSKANPGKLNFGATAATTQLTGEQLRLLGANLVHVPYKGTAQLVPAITSGEIHLVIDGHTNYVPFVRDGKLRAIGLVSPGKDALLPDVQNVRDQGYPELERLGWWALFGPANLPAPVLARLSDAALWTLKQPDFLAKQAALGLTPRPGTPDELAAQVKADIARWTPIIRAAGIKLD
ncbi:MAG: tripartite tricarboxylate transporter substrate binding protein [Betaproteobacteria bacterium]|nr:tripartite tricarboxylate transporter substrate binding protein [Betaproteobacteria bacterium]